ncbi:MAG: hypothetical protein O2887_14155 [Bacteroidetes bacterium]|nr:hypothetical protein [Bacteroidota bacterium]MDA1121612.1 hypothetical protein [Bacteroidota bacterium]
MRNLIVVIAVVSLAGIGTASAQQEFGENSSFLDRVYTGGGINLSIGSNVTIIGASPILGYMITDKLSAGIGVTYMYYRLNRADLSTSIYGGKVFTQYTVYQPIILYSEYQALSYDFVLGDGIDDREIISSLNVGGGIMQPIGSVVNFQLLLLYDLLYDNLKSPEPNALSLRGGITVGF